MSNLSVIEPITENSQATPGLWNQRFSVISANFAALNSDLTIDFASGQTLSVLSNIDATGNIHGAGRLGIGPTPSAETTGTVTIAVNSGLSDYIHFEDTSAARSNYLLGSRVGGTADGLNIYDISGDTMIVSFSKQSVRFYQAVVGPVVDNGGQYVNVKAYGALGDDTADDTGSLHLAASAASGNILYFPSGVYKTTSSVTIYSNTIVQMQPGAVIKQYTETQRAFYISGTSNVKLRDCTVDYNTASVRQAVPAIELVSSSNFEILGCRIIKAPGLGIYTANNRRGRILSNIVEDTLADGIHVTNGGSSNMSSRDISIINNVCNNTGDDGIAVVSYLAGGPAICEAITITGNVIGQCATRAITVAGGQFITITANTVRDTQGSTGINVMNDDVFSTYSATDIVVSNNVIEAAAGATASTRAGIRVYRAPRTIVIGNVVAWKQGEGIHLYGASDSSIFDCQIANNIISGATVGEQGIHIQHAKNILIQGNSIVSAAKSAMFIENFENIQVLGNQVDEANLINTGATNLITVINGTRASVIGNFLLQTGTAFTHGIGYSTATDILSAHNILRKTAVMSGLTINATSVKSLDLQDFIGSQGIPPLHTSSELSLGWYRSAASNLALSYGTLQMSGAIASFSSVDFRTGTTINPSWNFASERSLGVFRSGASVMRMTYGQFSADSGSATTPGIALSNASVGFYQSGLATISISSGTFNLATNSVRLSVRTAASLDSTNLAVNEMAFTFIASGASLGIRSGSTIYYFTSSSSTKA